MRRAGLLLVVVLAGCRPGIYDIDRTDDPVDKARFSCQYIVERALATDEEKDPDGVLRRRIAEFAEPEVVREGDVVRTRWRHGQIVLTKDGSLHGGGCTMTLQPHIRHVDAAELDERALHAGFGI